MNLATLLRSPAAVADECRRDGDVRGIVLQSLLTIAAGGAVFGGVVGASSGGRQIVYAALKLPLAMLAALVVFVPAFYAISAVFERRWTLRAIVALAVAAGARLGLALLAAAPVLWLVIDLGAPYEAVKLVAASAYALGGLAALRLFLPGIGPGPGRRTMSVVLMAVLLLGGGQTAWVLRPYLGDPERPAVPFLASEREGGLVVQLVVAVRRVVQR